MMDRPLILVTNDDGIRSNGLWAAAEALAPLGTIVVVAPDRQWSGAGRSMPHRVTGRIRAAGRVIDGKWITGYSVDASPALAVVHAMTEILLAKPDLVVSGINLGANLGIEVTISGTVGAALEASAWGLPAIAISLEMDPALHLSLEGAPMSEYAASQHILTELARRTLASGHWHERHILNINVPADADHDTPWVPTRLSRRRFYIPTAPDRSMGSTRPGYRLIDTPESAETGSDIRVTLADRKISVTPLTLDLTDHGSLASLQVAKIDTTPAMTLA